jgi:hypothetical protein
MKKILLGAVIGSLVTALLFVYFQPRPGPGEPVKDKIISGQITGTAQIKPKIDLQGEGKVSTPKPSTDFKTAVPVAGKIETKQTKIEFTGTTTVERTGDQLKVDTVFNPDITETIKQDPAKAWHVGGEIIADKDGLCVGGHVQKDFTIWHNLAAFGRAEADREVRLKAGIEYSF